MDEELQIMFDRAVDLVDPIADENWAADCLPLMPTFQRRKEGEAEEARRIELDEANRQAEEERRQAIAQQLEQGRLERETERAKRKQAQKEARQRSRAKNDGDLSPSATRAVAKRKSASSLGESVSGGEVNALVKVKGKGKGKSKKGEEVLRDPRGLEPGTIEASNSSQVFLSRFDKGLCFSGVGSLPGLRESWLSVLPSSRPPESVREMQKPQGQVRVPGRRRQRCPGSNREDPQSAY